MMESPLFPPSVDPTPNTPSKKKSKRKDSNVEIHFCFGSKRTKENCGCVWVFEFPRNDSTNTIQEDTPPLECRPSTFQDRTVVRNE
mmetsp:Transcript_11281/g.12400  ORF Transcript_11281/g.12400 Transcript_11281/m.12400 type:complete len:86 (-) Transcript_11281:60-317(-)